MDKTLSGGEINDGNKTRVALCFPPRITGEDSPETTARNKWQTRQSPDFSPKIDSRTASAARVFFLVACLLLASGRV